MSGAPLLALDGLSIAGGHGQILVEDVGFAINPGETLAVVGESGSGKTLTALSLLGLLPERLRVTGGAARFGGQDLLRLDESALQHVRGAAIGMVFQEPMSALNPVVTIGTQMTEALRIHRGLGRAAAAAAAIRALDLVHLRDPAGLMRRYPHQLSGGMRQRVMIAGAMVLEPALLIADEPTTALDVTVQMQILRLLAEMKARFGTAILLITHDMGVVAECADRVVVLRQGRMQETGPVGAIFHAPRAAYTRTLLAAVPRSDAGTTPPAVRSAAAGAAGTGTPPVLAIERVSRSFRAGGLFRRQHHVAVDGVSLAIAAGETLALVGESGSGKTTLGRAVLGLEEIDAGRILLDGTDLRTTRGAARQALRRHVQIVFQDPYASLDPRMKVGDAIAEPLTLLGLLRGAAARARARALLQEVGLPADFADRYPHQLSGGQRQRVAIARAIGIGPRLLVADEPTSSLDVSVQAHVLDLMATLQARLGLACLFISHDLAIVRRVAHRVAVMRAGRVVETGPVDAVLDRPQDPYTRALIAAVPVPDPNRARCRAGGLVAPTGIDRGVADAAGTGRGVVPCGAADPAVR